MNKQEQASVRNISKQTRFWRKIHSYLGLVMATLLIISAFTGVLLSLKKQVPIIQPVEQKAEKSTLAEWLTMNELAEKANEALKSAAPEVQLTLDRIDARPKKGLLKMVYMPGYWEVQVEGSTGKVLSVQKRYSDVIEKIHDGSILGDIFSLVSMNFLGWGTLLLIFTGIWIWYSPIRIRNLKGI